jgi:hypothetical protein
LRLCARVDPAGMNTPVERVRHLRINRCAESGQTAKCSLDVTTGAAEPVIKVEMPESGIEVIEPHQTYDTAAEPDAFWISCRTVDGLRRFCKFIGFALTVLRDIGR